MTVFGGATVGLAQTLIGCNRDLATLKYELRDSSRVQPPTLPDIWHEVGARVEERTNFTHDFPY
jgi:hypothetical protein